MAARWVGDSEDAPDLVRRYTAEQRRRARALMLVRRLGFSTLAAFAAIAMVRKDLLVWWLIVSVGLLAAFCAAWFVTRSVRRGMRAGELAVTMAESLDPRYLSTLVQIACGYADGPDAPPKHERRVVNAARAAVRKMLRITPPDADAVKEAAPLLVRFICDSSRSPLADDAVTAGFIAAIVGAISPSGDHTADRCIERLTDRRFPAEVRSAASRWLADAPSRRAEFAAQAELLRSAQQPSGAPADLPRVPRVEPDQDLLRAHSASDRRQ